MRLRTKQFLAVFVGILVGGVMIGLGLWQTARYQSSIEDVASERAQLEAVELAPHVHDDGTIDDVFGRQVSVVGTWTDGFEVYVGTDVPLRFAKAFQLEDGRYIPIVVGHIDDASTISWPTEPVELTGVFTSGDTSVDGQVPDGAPPGSLSSLRLQRLVQVWPNPLIAGYVTVSPAIAEDYGMTPAQAVLPEQEGTGMHRGYALQWWVFAVAAVVFGVIVARGFGKDSQPAATAAR